MSRIDYHYCSLRPWYNEPLPQVLLDGYKTDGYLDENGNITPLGKKHHIVKEKLLGTETREHYEEYLKHWDPFFEKWFKWATDERIPEKDEPIFDYVETWDSEK